MSCLGINLSIGTTIKTESAIKKNGSKPDSKARYDITEISVTEPTANLIHLWYHQALVQRCCSFNESPFMNIVKHLSKIESNCC